MNNPWFKVLVFSLLFGAVGFLLGRECGHGCRGRERGHCEKGATCHGESACDHGGACCTEGGTCDKADCDHTMGGACCKGHGMGHMGRCEGHGGEGMKACCKGMGHTAAEDEAQAAVDRIKASSFQGDTTVKITGGHVNIHKQGDKLEVMIELADSTHAAAGHGAHH